MAKCFGTRFDPEGIAELIPEGLEVAAGPPLSASSTLSPMLAPPRQPSAAGRPPKAFFWEDAIIAVFKLVHEGDLQPRTLADVEHALDDWLVLNGHHAGETVVRERARKIWKVLKPEVGN